MPSICVACPLAAFGGSMRPWYGIAHVEVNWHSRVWVGKLQSVRPHTRKLALYTRVLYTCTSTFWARVLVRVSLRAKLQVRDYSYELNIELRGQSRSVLDTGQSGPDSIYRLILTVFPRCPCWCVCRFVYSHSCYLLSFILDFCIEVQQCICYNISTSCNTLQVCCAYVSTPSSELLAVLEKNLVVALAKMLLRILLYFTESCALAR